MNGRTSIMILDECEKLETIQVNGYPSSISKHGYLRLSNLRAQIQTFGKSLDKKLQTRSCNKLLTGKLSIIPRS